MILGYINEMYLALLDQDDSRPPLYEETTGGQMGGGDSSEEDEEDQKEPPAEPTRFGWVQGVMVGRDGPAGTEYK